VSSEISDLCEISELLLFVSSVATSDVLISDLIFRDNFLLSDISR